ncbi:potassium transporter [Campylobacter fetus]|uniref:cation:proton antiporter n=1 Tax=Campylobacter fetus TaxID=196 RepID=UPI0005092515|nr:cation:proton antiporter [Campylobacter fetus]WKW18044.1 cation:proton antiporter [Campylobacter fetus subsp. fetus]AIR78688.1 K+/H+ antiporter [Campylobacter fetus subsp. fetus 04/554]EAJ5693098.1 potassium transporter [Campylobacter fetus]EAJ5704683.1 potassium transporter [Campylobacter fetus]EAJ9256252.1 potassium transporter [Campylobacter fetus]
MDNFLELFLAATAFAIVLNVFFKRYEIPTIIGYIVTGIFISKTFGLTYNTDLTHIAEFGIVFLMFTIGLEFSFKHLLTMKKEVFLNGIIQVFVTGIIFSMIAQYAFDIGQQTSLIIGFALSLSSTAIVLKTLNDNGDISQVYGRKALGILLFQDIAVIPLLLMIDIFSSKTTSVSDLVTTTLTSAIILLFLLYFIGKYLFNWMLYLVIKTNSQEIFITTILFSVVGASFLAHYFGFSYSLGAFIAGMLIAETQYKHQIEADLIPFRDLLLGLFFITVGMQINFEIIFENLLMIIVILVDVMVIKIAVVYALLATYLKKRVAIKTALSICQIGEFALAIFALLNVNNMLNSETSQILTAVVIISMVATPFILKNIGHLADRLEEESEIPEFEKLKVQDLSDHFIVCGYGRLGQEVVNRLKAQGLLYLVIESDISLVQLGRSRGENVFFGNATQKITLEKASIKTCAAIILTVSNEQKLEMIANSIKDIDYPVNTVIRFTGTEEKQLYADFGENFHLIKEERAVARVLIHEALQCKIDRNI